MILIKKISKIKVKLEMIMVYIMIKHIKIISKKKQFFAKENKSSPDNKYNYGDN